MNKRTRSQRNEDDELYFEANGKKRHHLRSMNGKTLLSKKLDIPEDEVSEFSDSDSDDFDLNKKKKVKILIFFF